MREREGTFSWEGKRERDYHYVCETERERERKTTCCEQNRSLQQPLQTDLHDHAYS